MKLSLEWLSEFVDTGVSPKEYIAGMTLSGSKAEGLEEHGADIVRVVVGHVRSVEPHPNADRLRICRVDAGAGAPVRIVTGAANVAAEDWVPVALDGAVLPGGKTIRTGELRGVASAGMLCSLGELGLTKADFPEAAEDGIFILDKEGLTPGRDIREALGLGGYTAEFEITNNRPDCLSVIGLARESAATFDKPLTLHTPAVKGGGEDINGLLSVRVDAPELCPRYTARMVRDVRIEPSPRWLRTRLRASGVRPINNIVDITNYVMLEYGQPMHAFDYACVRDKTIVVRRAADGETLDTLDGKARALQGDMLVIADAARPVGVAGVMGGANSEITEATRDIVFESANFYGPSVRRTALALGMRTDASSRFEKGLDPLGTVPAVQRACELVELLGAGTVCQGLIDVCADAPAPRVLPVESEKINALLGAEISEGEMYGYLTRFGFERADGGVTVPSWRADVEGMADLAEEVARLYGYNRIATAGLSGGARGGLSGKQRLERLTRETCRALGYSEILTYSFIGASWYDALSWTPDDPRRAGVIIENPLGEETAVMRVTALPSLLRALAANEALRAKEARLFELAMTYRPGGPEGLPDERPMLILGGYGGLDFYALKGAVEAILRALWVKDVSFTAAGDVSFHPGRCARVGCGNTVLGLLGEIHPATARAFGGEQRLYAAELDFLSLLACRAPEGVFAPLPRFPAVTRDLAVVCAADMPAARLAEAIRRGAGALLTECRPFDVYTGGQIEAGRKSVAFALTLRSDERTLTDGEADAAVAGALAALAADCGAALRV
ncbi:MAG: phenylalanine--tRNA ligase subunit beta [Oscillospiraceae bacterium]|nr:phenylalanine--tRNA ligase subunit beta [Oscillospiraceae bacterium]